LTSAEAAGAAARDPFRSKFRRVEKPMPIASQSTAHPKPSGHSGGHGPVPTHHAPVSPGKVAMWLFLATEVMFFTGLIGTYIVLRAGSSHTAYSNIYSPGTNLQGLEDTKGILVHDVGSNEHEVERILRTDAGLKEEQVKTIIHGAPHGIVPGRPAELAEALEKKLHAAGATVELEKFETYKWPVPYHEIVNPLAINLTAANTFVLICSSVTMVLALSAIQSGNRARCNVFLLATVIIGSIFLSIQVYEYRQLMFMHAYPVGISANGHFVPSCSLFASCFFTMTGFHGAHVTGGVILLTCVFIASLRGAFSATNYSTIELAGLYWHFVDLVWIILFTIVYLL
jgi:heme/copper-type cytochrome/quinol oxidase subunit 3